ncbi:aminotransferase class V-fold PLP-dependent enzyme, partial [Candidatus Margulisiibacteriota bacterium]
MTKSKYFEIENSISNMFEKEHGIFMRNATTAIWALLKALGFKQKKIIIPVNICYVVPLAILLSGNEPCFVDIDDNFTIDPAELKKINSKQAKAVIFPHMYGNTGNINDILKICKKKSWVVIEDVAQSLGAKIGNHYVGSFGDFSVTSFGWGKIIDVNMGGVLCLNSKQLYKETVRIYDSLPVLSEKISSARQHFSQLYFLMVDCIENGEDLHRLGVPLAYTYNDCFLNKIGSDSDLPFLPILEKRFKLLQKELDIRNQNAQYFQTLIKHENVSLLSH